MATGELSAALDLALKGYEAAKWVWMTAKKTRNAPAAWASLNTAFLKQPKVKTELLIEAIEDILARLTVDPSVREALESLKEDLQADVGKIESYFENGQPVNFTKCVGFAMKGEEGIRELLKQLELHAGNVVTWLHLLDLSFGRRLVDSVLRPDVIRLQGRDNGKQVPGLPWLSTCEASYKPDSRVDAIAIEVLVESVDGGCVMDMITKNLKGRIGNGGQGDAAGILPCLGFMQGPNRLLFRLPRNALVPQTLRVAMMERDGEDVPLEVRFDLARQLAHAVFMLSTAELMHKNISSDTALLLRPNPDIPIPDVEDQGPTTTAGQSSDTQNPGDKPEASKTGVLRRAWRSVSRGRGRSKRQDGDDGSDPEGPNGKPEPSKAGVLQRMSHSLSRRRSRSNKGERVKKKAGEERGRPRARSDDLNPTAGEALRPQLGMLEQWLPSGSTTVILSGWSQAQMRGNTEDLIGPDPGDWHLKVYRHPGQQRPEKNEQYNIGHDIYALGVCLLEIGMWSPLVMGPDGGGQQPSASQDLLKAGGHAAGRWLKDTLKAAWKYKDGGEEGRAPAYQLKEVVEEALKYEVAVMAAVLLKSRENRCSAAHLMRKAVNVVTGNGTRLVRLRLRAAMRETLMELLDEEQADVETTIRAARDLEDAVAEVAESDDFENYIRETTDRLKKMAKKAAMATQPEGRNDNDTGTVEVINNVSAVMKQVKSQKGTSGAVLKVIRDIEKCLKEAARNCGKGQNNFPRLKQEVKGKVKNSIDSEQPAGLDELEELLKKEGGGVALRDALVHLAEQRLPLNMGNTYKALVVKCLGCGESKLGPADKVTQEGHRDTCVAFGEEIVVPLRREGLRH